MARGAAAVTMLGLLVAACSGSGSLSPPPVERLVVIDDGEVVTMDPSGSDRVVIGEGIGGVPFQPIWSPDGGRIAYSFTAADGDVGLAVADAATGTAETVTLPGRAFYLYWSPTGDRVGTLRNDVQGGIAFEIVTVGEAGLVVDEVDNGGSYYFAWSPDGDDVAVHVGTDRLEVLTGGRFEVLDEAPGTFQAPQWTDDGIVAARFSSGRPSLTRFGTEGAHDTLVEVAGPTAFHVSPGGERLAIQSTGGSGLVEAMAQTPAVEQPLRPDRLHVVELASGTVVEVVDHLVAGFWWSPNGERLLLLEAAGNGRPHLVWRIWEDDALIDGPRFQPDPGWLQELVPFIDQYNRSMTLWAPDSTAFSFPGTIDGEAGVWVSATDGSAPVKVSEGSWVAWSWS